MISLADAVNRLENNYNLTFINDDTEIRFTKSKRSSANHTMYRAIVKDRKIGAGIGFYFPYESIIEMITEHLEESKWLSVE